jgi:hypothetical protein
MKGSVKIMQSYDYNHFEVTLSSDEEMDLKQINEMRKEAQRLTDEAIRQYKVSKQKAASRDKLDYERKSLANEVEHIKQKPENEWTAEERAKIKAIADDIYFNQHNYNYDDDSDITF